MTVVGGSKVQDQYQACGSSAGARGKHARALKACERLAVANAKMPVDETGPGAGAESCPERAVAVASGGE
jgi:hypothetical protein